MKTLIHAFILEMENGASDDPLAKICLVMSDIMALCDTKPALEATALVQIRELTTHFHNIVTQSNLASNSDTTANPPSPPSQVEHSPTLPEPNPTDTPSAPDSTHLPFPTD
jgi:hypothetical protein